MTPPYALLGALLGALLAGLQVGEQVPTNPGPDPGIFDSRHWIRFGVEDGLPDDHVTSVVEAPDGTPWASTQRGLAWYDGYVWRPARGLKGNRPCDLAARADGEIVVAIGGEVYRGDRFGFQRIDLPASSGPFACEASADGDVLVLHTSGGRGPTTYHVVGDDLGPARSLDHAVFNIAQTLQTRDRDGSPWLSTQGEVLIHRADAWERGFELPPAWKLFAIDLDDRGDGLLYVDHPHEVRGLWERRDGELSLVHRSLQITHSLEVAPDGDAFVVLSSDEVLWRHDDQWARLGPRPPEMYGINTIVGREGGGFWVATSYGLFLYRPDPPHLEHWVHGNSSGTQPIEYLAASDRSIWVGTTDGVERRDKNGGVERFSAVDGQSIHTVTALAEDENGGIWIGSGAGSFAGAYRFDGHTWQHYGPAEGLDIAGVHRIRKDTTGRLWFLGIQPGFSGPRDEPGACVWNGADFEPWGTESGLISGRVYDFVDLPDGSLWFATVAGISRWREGTWRHWNRASGLRRDRVWTLASDKHDRVWFGHGTGPGLGFFAGDEPEYVDLEAGARPLYVMTLKRDDSDQLWVGSQEGVWTLTNDWAHAVGRDRLGSDDVVELLPLPDRLLVGLRRGGTDVISRRHFGRPPIVYTHVHPLESGDALVHFDVRSFWKTRFEAMIPLRWRVDGGPWTPWTTEREVTLEGLGAGAHTLFVETMSLLGRPTDAYRVPFERVPRMHERPAVVVPSVLLGLLLIASLGSQLLRRKSQRRTMEESEERYRRLVEALPDAVVIHRDGRYVFVNPAAARLLGLRSARDMIGRSVAEFISEEDQPRVESKLEELEHYGVPAGTQFRRYRLWNGGSIDVEASSATTMFDGRPAYQSVIRDVTERKRHEEHRTLLAAELDHRVKNNMAGVIAIAEHSFTRGSSYDEFRESFTGRVRAMARAHEALAAARWRGVDLRPIALTVLRPFDPRDGTISIDGPSLRVRPRATTPIAMALHELATNAVKYGSLSSTTGQLSVTWTVASSTVRIVWEESGGPAPVPPSGLGGLQLIRGVVEYELAGEAQFDFVPSGLRCTLILPLDSLLAEDGDYDVVLEPQPPAAGGPERPAAPPVTAAKREE